jgi:hypothetical protein
MNKNDVLMFIISMIIVTGRWKLSIGRYEIK